MRHRPGNADRATGATSPQHHRQKGQPPSRDSRTDSHRAGAATEPSTGTRDGTPPPLQAPPKTDSHRRNRCRSCCKTFGNPFPQLLAVSQESDNTLIAAVASSQTERVLTPHQHPQQGNPTPPQTQHTYCEAVELILSRIFPRADKLPTKPQNTAHNPQRTPQN